MPTLVFVRMWYFFWFWAAATPSGWRIMLALSLLFLLARRTAKIHHLHKHWTSMHKWILHWLIFSRFQNTCPSLKTEMERNLFWGLWILVILYARRWTLSHELHKAEIDLDSKGCKSYTIWPDFGSTIRWVTMLINDGAGLRSCVTNSCFSLCSCITLPWRCGCQSPQRHPWFLSCRYCSFVLHGHILYSL